MFDEPNPVSHAGLASDGVERSAQNRQAAGRVTTRWRRIWVQGLSLRILLGLDPVGVVGGWG